MFVNLEVKAPDDRDWVALVNITAAGEATTIGYIDRATLEELLAATKQLGASYENWLAR